MVWPDKKVGETTVQNVESRIEVWADKFGWAIRRVEEPEMSSQYYLFVWEITLRDGTRFKVGRSKQRDNYLACVSQLVLSPEQKTVLDNMDQGPDSPLMHELSLELSRLGPRVGFKFIGPPLSEVQILKMVPINSNLTESTFADAVTDIDSGSISAREYVNVEVRKYSHNSGEATH